MLDQAREYLARIVPWPQPGQVGFVNVHWTFPPKKPRADGKPAWSGRAVTSLSEAIKAIEFAQKSADTLDIYACMSLQNAAEAKQSRKPGSTYKFNIPIRLAGNAVSLQSLFLDIDLKAPQVDPATGQLKAIQKGYATDGELVAAFVAFLSATGLPKPSMVVHSGGGVHVYWMLDRALSPDEWLPLAHALAEATRVHGLRCDTQCTVDSARVLRIPDTFNRKETTPRAVRFVGKPLDYSYSVQRIATALQPFIGKVHIPPAISGLHIDSSLFPRLIPYAGPSELQNNLDQVFPSPDLDLVALGCGFVADTLKTGGSNNDNALWNYTNLIATFTKGGRVDAHRMGAQHVTYKPEETDEQFDRKDREKSARGLGWPSCNAIATAGAKACRSCAFFAQGKSPLNFEQRPAQNAAGQANGAVAGVVYASGPAQAVAPPMSAAPAAIQTAFGAGTPAANTTGSAPVAGVAGTTLGYAPGPTPGPALNDLPDLHGRDANGIIYKLVEDPGNPGSKIQLAISKYPMLDAWLQNDPKVLHFHSIVDRGRHTQIDLPLEVVSTNEMRKCLQAQGLMLPPKIEHVGEFFLAWVQQLQKIKDAVTSSPFGWLNTSGQLDGFVFGDKLWTPTGSEPAATGSPKLAIRYRPKGTDQYWLDACKLVTQQGRPDLEAVIASAFAAPLVVFTGHRGMLMSAFSRESGIGKSTAIAIAQSVWGNPVKGIQGLNDTENAVMNIVGEIKSLPLYWDELKTDQDTKKFVKMTFQISAGKEKSRMNSKAELREPGDWQTLVISASNESLIDHVTSQTLTTEAGLMRIFEFGVARSTKGQVGTSEATIRLSQLNNNFGHVGLKYAQFLGANHSTIANDMRALTKQIEQDTKAQQEERFWVALIACILLGARYAAQVGYPVFDEKSLKKFMYEALEGMRKHRTSQTVDLDKVINVSTIMNRFFNDMKRDSRWLVTNLIHVGAGKPPKPGNPGHVKVYFPSDTTRLNGVAVQVGIGNQMIRISSPAFGEWCKKTEMNRQNLLDALRKQIPVQNINGKMGAGTGLAGATEHIYELDISNSPEFDFVSEMVQ